MKKVIDIIKLNIGVVFNYLCVCIVATVLFSCSPQTKESYLEDYKEFVLNVHNDSGSYSEQDWLDSDETFLYFSEDLYQNFEEDFTWKENILLSKYAIEYNALKIKNEFSGISEIFEKKDYEKLKEQIKYYSENNMKEDLEFLINEAEELGQISVDTVEEILRELEQNNEE
jgi:hypothetical protein